MLLCFCLKYLKFSTLFLLIIFVVTLFLNTTREQNQTLHSGKITDSNECNWYSSGKNENNYQQVNVERILCQIGDVLPNGAFCLSRKGNLMKGMIGALDGQLCKNIEKLVQFSSVVDFGAGLGQYGKCFLRDFKKINTLFSKKLSTLKISNQPQVIKSYEGYDGAMNVEEITNNFVKRIDLSSSFDLGRRFDWVLSLEVGEHIHKDAEDIFLGNLIRHSCKGIILSWAIPGQPGLEHVNLRTNEYIISKMKEKGFKNNVISQQFLRNRVHFSYFKNTVMVFERSKKLC